MNKEQFDINLVPTWRQGYRFQFEPAQNGFVILYPEGMIKLNESAGAIGQYIDGKNRPLAKVVIASSSDLPVQRLS